MSKSRGSVSFNSSVSSPTTSNIGQEKRPSTVSLLGRLSTSGRRLSSHASIRPKVELTQILQNKTKSPISLAQFRKFMTDVERGAESLNFWEDVEKLKGLENKKKTKDLEDGRDVGLDAEIKQAVDHIVATYIKPGASQELNITSVARKEVMAALSRNPDTPSSVFINIQKHCFELMSLNTLPRFLTESMRNIDQEGIQFRLWFAALPGAVALVALTVIAWTMPSFERRYRWTTSIPAVIFFVGLWQSYLSFCICHGFLGTMKFGSQIEEVESCVRTSHTRKALFITLLTLASSCAWVCMVYFVPLNTFD